MKNVYFIQNDQKKNYYTYIFERYNATMVLYTRWDSDILVQPSTQQQRHSIKDNTGWRSKATEKSQTKKRKKEKRYKKKFLKNQVISIPSFSISVVKENYISED